MANDVGMLKIKRSMRRNHRRHVIDLRDSAWEYDRVEIPRGDGGEDGVEVIQQLLVGRATAGWDVDGVSADADWCRFVFKRPVA